MATERPFFRADHVGSLLRPKALLDARAKFAKGEMTREQLRAAEDAAIANATALVSWVVDTDATNTTAAIASVFLNIDGADQTSPMTIHEQGTSNDARATVAQQSTVTLAAAGSHTIKLRGQRVSGTGGVTVKQTHTTLRVLVIEVV